MRSRRGWAELLKREGGMRGDAARTERAAQRYLGEDTEGVCVCGEAKQGARHEFRIEV